MNSLKKTFQELLKNNKHFAKLMQGAFLMQIFKG